MRSRVELFEAIRRDHRREDLSIRQLAARYGVHRRTVRLALASVEPPPRKTPRRVAPKLDLVAPLVDAMLREDLSAPRKQQHTARRVLARLVDEHGITDVSYWTVRDYVARRRPQIAAEAGRVLEQVFVPQSHARARRVRLILLTCGLIWLGSARRCFCLPSGCRAQARRSIARSAPRARRRSCRAIWKRFGCWAASRRCMCAMTI